MKKDLLTPILSPIITILAAAVVLLAANFGLKGVEAKNASNQRLYLMQTVLPGSYVFTEEAYTGEDANIVSVHKGDTGYVVEATTYSYGGYLTMLVGVDNSGKVNGVVITDMNDTQGIGTRALNDVPFLAQFIWKDGNFVVETASSHSEETAADGTVEESTDAVTSATSGATTVVAEDGSSNDVDGISGATVTSKAVVRCINSAVNFVTGADVDATSTATVGG